MLASPTARGALQRLLVLASSACLLQVAPACGSTSDDPAAGAAGLSGSAGTASGAAGKGGSPGSSGAAGAAGSGSTGNCTTPPAGSALVGWAAQSGMSVTTT